MTGITSSHFLCQSLPLGSPIGERTEEISVHTSFHVLMSLLSDSDASNMMDSAGIIIKKDHYSRTLNPNCSLLIVIKGVYKSYQAPETHQRSSTTPT